MYDRLIKGLGTCVKSVDKSGDTHFKYEYPPHVKVVVELIHNVYYVKIGNKVISTFGPNDSQSVYDYVEFD